MAEFSIMTNEQGEVAVVCIAQKHLPPEAIAVENGRLVLRLSAGAKADAGAISTVAAASLETADTALFATISGPGVIGEDIVPIVKPAKGKGRV